MAIQASKVGACDIRPGRRPEGAERDDLTRLYQVRAGLTSASGNEKLTDPEELAELEDLDRMRNARKEDDRDR
ncbi:hypothetical protein QP028_01915 [Corynebacterium suedekumii]|nr:hypothetical protein QP028_01915 [Corynebacterium suedekumii]